MEVMSWGKEGKNSRSSVMNIITQDTMKRPALQIRQCEDTQLGIVIWIILPFKVKAWNLDIVAQAQRNTGGSWARR